MSIYYKYIIALLSSPKEAWADLEKEDAKVSFTTFTYYLYTMMGFVVISVLLHAYRTDLTEDGQALFQLVTEELASTFLGYYFICFVLNAFFIRKKHFSISPRQIQYVVGHIYALQCLVWGMLNIFPALFFLNFINLFYLYIIKAAADQYLKIPDHDSNFFVLSTWVIVVVLPFLLDALFHCIMP